VRWLLATLRERDDGSRCWTAPAVTSGGPVRPLGAAQRLTGLMEAVKPGSGDRCGAEEVPRRPADQTVQLVRKSKAEPDGSKGVCQRIGEQLGINPETLREWVMHAESTLGSGRELRRIRRPGWLIEGGEPGTAAGERDPEVRRLSHESDPRSRLGARPCRGLPDSTVEHGARLRVLCEPVELEVVGGGCGWWCR
jgi:hypothetical protein